MPTFPSKTVVVIGGPTASGKSGLALELAERRNGTIINADSMQVYAELRVLTARPAPEEEARVPHRLYGVVSAAERMSAARWRDLALAEIRAAQEEGRLPIVVGGTGLYLRALMRGLADIPPIPKEVQEATLALQREIGSPGLHARLAERDPEMAARLQPGDTQRLIRAWEVLEGTGRSLADWQREPAENPATDLIFLPMVVQPPRDWLYANCDARLLLMLRHGAWDEVRHLISLGLDPELPAMKALGVPELSACLAGEIDAAMATARAQQMTRNYAKRQLTWFRHQLGAVRRIDPADFPEKSAREKLYERLVCEIGSIITEIG